MDEGYYRLRREYCLYDGWNRYLETVESRLVPLIVGILNGEGMVPSKVRAEKTRLPFMAESGMSY